VVVVPQEGLEVGGREGRAVGGRGAGDERLEEALSVVGIGARRPFTQVLLGLPMTIIKMRK
jgi:hypothetical protein